MNLRLAAKVESMLQQTEDLALLGFVLAKVVDRIAEIEGSED